MTIKYGVIRSDISGVFQQCWVDGENYKRWTEDKSVAEATLGNLKRLYPSYTYALIEKAQKPSWA